MRLSGLLDLTALNARGAHTDPLVRSIDHRMYFLQIQVPAALGHIMRVAHLVAELRTTLTDITRLRHVLSLTHRYQENLCLGLSTADWMAETGSMTGSGSGVRSTGATAAGTTGAATSGACGGAASVRRVGIVKGVRATAVAMDLVDSEAVNSWTWAFNSRSAVWSSTKQ